MKIMGIDPGLATTGFCVLEQQRGSLTLLEYGCIKTEKTLSNGERLKQISDDLRYLIQKWKPCKASIEKLFFNKNVKTAISVAQARGIILKELEDFGVEQNEFSPLEIKSSVCGYGKADKKMIQNMVGILLKMKTAPKQDDAADAIAAAICLANNQHNPQYK